MEEQPRVAVYLRKSRKEEHADLVQTLCRHREQLMQLAQQQGLSVLRVYEEVVSGDSLCARPQMCALLQAVEAGEYAAVLCMDIDRLGRGGMREQGLILDTFKGSGTKIITPDKVYDLSDEMDEELTELKTFLSRRELKLIKKRLRRGLSHTIEEGGYVANEPYGYRKTRRERKPTLEIFEPEACFVRMIFTLYVQEGMGCQSIAQTINALGARPHRSAAFSRSSVAFILKNPVYTGKVVWNQHRRAGPGPRARPPEEWTVVRGLHPAIVSEELFERAARRLRSRSSPPASHGTVRNPLAGLVRCARCGAKLQRLSGAAKGGADYLLCPTKGCMPGTKLELVEQALLEALGPYLERVPAVPCASPDAEERTRILRQAERNHRAFAAQRERLYDLLEQGVYDRETFERRMAELDGRLALLEKETARLRVAVGDKGPHAFSSLQDACLAALPADRNRLLKLVVEEICYQKQKGAAPGAFELTVKLRRDFLYLAQSLSLQLS